MDDFSDDVNVTDMYSRGVKKMIFAKLMAAPSVSCTYSPKNMPQKIWRKNYDI